MTVHFHGRRALVTGAARGIGQAIAVHLAACGAHVVGADVDAAGLDVTRKLVGHASFTALIVNLMDDADIARAVTEAGPIDCLVNAAGAAVFEPFLKTTRGAYDLQFGVNVRGLMQLTQLVSAAMVKRVEAGERHDAYAVVNVSSQSSTIALRDHLVYSTTKAAVDHITRITALELAKHGIRVNAVRPTVVRTQLAIDNWGEDGLKRVAADIPLGRLAEPIDVAKTVAFLLSPHAGMITGETVLVDGGYVSSR